MVLRFVPDINLLGMECVGRLARKKMATNFIQTATDLIDQKRWQEAKSLLVEGLSNKPADWAPIET